MADHSSMIYGLLGDALLPDWCHPAPTQDVDNGEMLARLRLDALVRRDDEEDEIDAGGADQHVLHEAFVPGNVHDRDPAAGGKRHVREAEIDRDPALLLFLEAIGVDAGDSADERGLAVVDVPRGADHDGAHEGLDGGGQALTRRIVAPSALSFSSSRS